MLLIRLNIKFLLLHSVNVFVMRVKKPEFSQQQRGLHLSGVHFFLFEILFTLLLVEQMLGASEWQIYYHLNY